MQPVSGGIRVDLEPTAEFPPGDKLTLEILVVRVGFEPPVVDLLLRWSLAQHIA
jgi:hypothetical protein